MSHELNALIRMILVLVISSILGCAGHIESAHPMTPWPLPGQDVPQGLFALHEMDMHLHSGMERPVPLQEWIDFAVADGRKVLIALDHRELYDRTPEELDAWIAEENLPKWYGSGKEGQESFMRDLQTLDRRPDVIAFHGWEIWEGEMDEGLDWEGMRRAEVIGWHISSNGEPPPCGKMLIRRIRQIIDVQKKVSVPMIVFHPFTAHIASVQRAAKERGRDPSSLTVDDYEIFQPGEQEEVCKLLRGKSIYIEMSAGQAKYWEDPAIREALTADIEPLAMGGVQFTVSTDRHGLAGIEDHFDPTNYCEALGVTPANTNTLVRELLAIRARRGLSAEDQETLK